MVDDVRLEVVRASRVLHSAGLGHVSWGFVAVRDARGRGLWITRDGVGFDEVVEDDVVLVSFDGVVIVGRGEPDEEASVAHEVMAVRGDVNAVVHAHSLHATAFASTSRRLQALSHEGCHLVAPDVARVHADRVTDEPSRAAREVASSLGAVTALLWPGHGLVTTGGSVGEAVALAVYLEKSCHLQLLVGEDGHRVPDEEVGLKRSGQLRRPAISWDYLRRVTPMS